MNIKKYLPYYLRIWRAIAIYALFVAVMAIGCFFLVFFSYSLTNRPLGDTLDPDMFLYPFIVQSIIIPLLLGSLLRIFAERDAVMKEEVYPGAEAVGSFKQNIGLILRSKFFRIEIATLVLLPVLLPLEWGFYPLTYLLFHNSTLSRAVQKLILLCIALPVLFAVSLWQHTSALYIWQEAEIAQREDNSGRLLAPILSTSGVYLLCLLILPSVISILLLAVMSLAVISVGLLGAVIAGVVLIFLLLRYLRALHIRRVFLKNLRKRCEKCGFTLSPIKRPYASVFRTKDEISFTVQAHGKTYDCKLLAGLSRSKAMSLSEDGIAHVIHIFGLRIVPQRHLYRMTMLHGDARRMLGGAQWYSHLELFRLTTKTDFSFESEAQKVLIVNPVPYLLQAGTEKSAQPIDNGDRVGAYKIFAGTAFLNALERDCVEK